MQPPEGEISRLFALMLPERAAKSPRTVTAPVADMRREVAGSVEAERECEAQEHVALLAAIAADRARRRRHEIAWHTMLIAVFLVIALPVLGVWTAKLLMPLALAR